MRAWLLRLLGADPAYIMRLEAERESVLLANQMLIQQNESLRRALEVRDTYEPSL